ncbi:M1-specific T cell receptor alpha chain-like [Anarhichas minor]|uniref:M1-specific T cell receptor alpha chain-like n=1 Tax=Anarhichas minor TaxID=65739 RepID=UPI003F741A19
MYIYIYISLNIFECVAVSVRAAVSQCLCSCCRLGVTGSGVYKIFFGSGTKLSVESKGENPPSFYKLSDGNISACLATDFSRNKAAKDENSLFNKTEAVQMKDGLYSQVALLSSQQELDTCDLAADNSDACEALQPDPKVNLMSLTILGLRLLFFKTVVFNVLMTLRLWMSQ